MINVLEICADATTIGISGHIKPDGDCIGSNLALWQFLKKVYPDKQIDVLLQETAPEFAFLDGIDKILHGKQETVYDVFFVLDSVPEASRIGDAYASFASARYTINVDHHITNEGVGDACYIDPKASSASELIYDLITYADPEGRYMDEMLAQTIYLGIIQDCGVFQYSNTSPKTMSIAAKLIGYGFDFPRMIEETFYQKSFMQNKLLGKVLTEASSHFDGAVIACALSLKEIAAVGVSEHEFSGIVNQLRYTKGCHGGLFIREITAGTWKVSIRSDEAIDASAVCAAFGGGGHMRAAGCIIQEKSVQTPGAALDAVLGEIKKQLG